jgi:hypothetical protein
MKTWIIEYINCRYVQTEKEVKAKNKMEAELKALEFDPQEYDDAVHEIISIYEKFD